VLGGTFPDTRLCPTGGIGEANAAAWLAEPTWSRVAAPGYVRGGYQVRQLERHNRHLQSDDEIAEPA